MKKQPSLDAINLSRDAAVEKIRQIVKSARVCLFGTSEGHPPLEVRPMAVQDVDAVGNVWFLSAASSFQNSQISRHPQVQLFFSNPGTSEYLSLQGRAFVSTSQPLKEKYWNPAASAWFKRGLEDPELTVIRVQTESGHYWDTEFGGSATILSLVVGAVTGAPVATEKHGEVFP